MRKSLLASSLSLLLASTAFSQTDRFAYVVTDMNKDGINWSYLRKIDLQSSTYSDVVLNGTDATKPVFDAATKKQLASPITDARFGTLANAAFGTGVAAIALDKKNNRLYYTPMFIDQLRYIDLKTLKVYVVSTPSFDALKVKAADQSNIITRMAFASDGNGYALTNDGNHLLKFTTGKKSTIVDLGTLVDDADNKGVSIHNSCSSYGGDMIADNDDNLYVFSARNHVFRINLETKVATHLGAVTGLPENFTINGAAVGSDNKIMVASATTNNALYTVDIKSWTATMINTGVIPWRSSDLATSNLLNTKTDRTIPLLLSSPEEVTNNKMQLYPNPVTNNHFTIQFNQPEGNYTILVTDVLGRQTVRAVASVKGKGQVQSIDLPADTKSGVYLVKVVDKDTKTIFSKKVLVQ
ncbi:MAG: T9SS type A sorting domain-containing protein [Chitinophagaceae bacterium]